MLRAAGMGAHETGPPHAWGPLAALAAHAGYERRRPEQTPLYRAVAGSLETLVELARQAGEPLPARIVRVFEKYLDCGILAKGFLRVRCESCHKETLVAFSCKQRGLCPSCAARHAAESAAWLVDRVLPDDPIRQWTGQAAVHWTAGRRCRSGCACASPAMAICAGACSTNAWAPCSNICARPAASGSAARGA
jgi:hypothetical protein